MSMFSSLVGMLDKSSLGGIAGTLGESEQSVSRGMESSIAAVLGGLAAKSEDPNSLRKILDLVPGTLGVVTGSQMASSVTNPDSPLLSAGKRVMSGLFGNSESAVTSALSAQSGLGPGVTSTLMAMAAPMVMSFIGGRVRAERMTMGGLGSLLQRESGTFRSALPAGLRDQFWPQASTASTAVTQAVTKESSPAKWLSALAITGLAMGFFLLFHHVPKSAIGTASRMATPRTNLGNFVERTLPDRVTLNVPENGIESRLLALIQNPAAKPDATTWFNFDRLVFDTGSKTLGPESQEQLNNIAAILVAYPNVQLKVGGYTDNVGNAEQNLQLSRDRANAVVAELVSKGISPDRLTAEGYGEQYSEAGNSTEEGRAQNRRVAMRVTQK
jgi:OOP family OmpA-OmpF porin